MSIRDQLVSLADDHDAEIAVRDERIEQLETELKEAKDELEIVVADIEAGALEMREALEAVKYWMLDVLVHHKPMRDPRKILRQVEGALEE